MPCEDMKIFSPLPCLYMMGHGNNKQEKILKRWRKKKGARNHASLVNKVVGIPQRFMSWLASGS